MSSLRPYQEDALRFVLNRADRRALLAHATSAGKTRTAIEFAKRIAARRILVVGSAMSRPGWKKQFELWSDYAAHTIRFGRTRKSLTKAQLAERDAAYLADVRVVSYKLVGQLDASANDLVVLDEVHALRNPLSQQSKIIRAYLRAHPAVPVLALTATPIPTEVKNLWNLLDTLWPGQFGKAQRTADISWDFLSRYCGRQETEYGVSFAGAKSPEALAELAKRLEPFIHRVTDREVAPFLPPLNAQPLWLDEQRTTPEVAQDWLADAGDGPRCLVVYHREEAEHLARAVGTDYVVTGESSPESRLARIRECVDAGGVLVATSESIRESISLSPFKRALIFEWRTSPAQALQLLGRFARQDAADMATPVFVEYVVPIGAESRAEKLWERIQDLNTLLASDKNSETLGAIFSHRPLTESRIEQMDRQALGRVRLSLAETEWDDD